MGKIHIKDLKSIKSLEFDIPVSGVHILTGINGSGKTTLLACLQRLTDSYAFQRHFRTSSNDQFDNFRNARIRYERNGAHVEYAYRNTRWSPTPKSGATLLTTMGYNNAVFISSSVDRFYVQNDELNTQGILAAPQFFKDSMNEIFQTTKYSNLRRKKLDGKGRGYGRWNYGFLMPAQSMGGQNQYYTEKNFSFGELLVLNALFQLENIADNSLILVDEIELALHPKVQVKLLHFLERQANQKNLTVIISTHSSSLIKKAKKLIYLERNAANGIVKVEYNCYPAVALQSMAIQEEVQPDLVFFVEDDYAKYILEQLINYYFINLNNHRRPIIKILPVGGWPQTLRFTIASANYLIPQNTRVYSFLDSDANADMQAIQVNANRSLSQQELLNLYNANQNRINYLPITPEQGLVELLNNQPHTHIQPLQDLFNEVFDISQIIIDEQNRGLVYSANPRQAAKMRIPYYIEQIKNLTNREENYIRIKLAEYYSSHYCPNNHPELHQVFGPIFN
ncbi:ATP-dependent nuclease [Flavobacterium lacisediminis]|uniref:AAA family ATPase n=1 Tax=Flavobacterium lacisediminis TaxID=2989705 RepID=A0ABT3EIW5_9FLAO|nr:AAA family ATPase [Flavobacterium lacisediminis]MCW1148374.1 AAA family ATPase [Flavobacterium lacisediminis]